MGGWVDGRMDVWMVEKMGGWVGGRKGGKNAGKTNQLTNSGGCWGDRAPNTAP